MGQGHSQRLRLADVREAGRLLGEVRELGRDPAGWRTHMLAGLCRLIGGNVGISVQVRRWEATLRPRIAILIDTGWATGAHRRNFQEFLAGESFSQDPHVQARTTIGIRDFTMSREQMVDDRTWYAAPTVNDGRRFADIDASIHSSRVLPDGGTDDLSLHRPWGARQFGERERQLVRFFHGELARLWRHRTDRAPGALGGLPRHLRVTLGRFLAGRSEKEAAADLGLSRHTVHAYTRELYQRVGVVTRAELLVKCVPVYDFVPRLVEDDDHVGAPDGTGRVSQG